MAINKQTTTARSSASEALIDQGLRAYMLRVYNYMGSALLVTGIVALLTFKFSVISLSPLTLSPLGNSLYNSGLAWVVMLAPLGVVLYMSFGIRKMSVSKAQTTFWIFFSIDGIIPIIYFFSLYGHVHYKSIFYYSRDFWSNEYLWLYDKKRSY